MLRRMSPTALRLWAIPLGLFAFALRVATAYWVEPLGSRLDWGTTLLVVAAAGLASAFIPYGILLALGGARRRRPASFTVSEGRLCVPPWPTYAASMAILWMYLSGGFVPTWTKDYDLTLADRLPAIVGSAILAGLMWAGALVFLLVQRPQLLLDPDGLTIRRLWRRTRIRWDDIAAGSPAPPTKRSPHQLKIQLQGPAVFGTFTPSEDIPVGLLHIDPSFLAVAIRHYVEHPDERATIGTAQPGTDRIPDPTLPAAPFAEPEARTGPTTARNSERRFMSRTGVSPARRAPIRP